MACGCGGDVGAARWIHLPSGCSADAGAAAAAGAAPRGISLSLLLGPPVIMSRGGGGVQLLQVRRRPGVQAVHCQGGRRPPACRAGPPARCLPGLSLPGCCSRAGAAGAPAAAAQSELLLSSALQRVGGGGFPSCRQPELHPAGPRRAARRAWQRPHDAQARNWCAPQGLGRARRMDLGGILAAPQGPLLRAQQAALAARPVCH